MVFWVANKRFVPERHRLGALASEDPPNLCLFYSRPDWGGGVLGCWSKEEENGSKTQGTLADTREENCRV